MPINVFPSQIESVLLKISKATPNYQIIVDRVGTTDTFEILVEISDDMFSDTVKTIEELAKKISDDIHSILGIRAKIKLVAPTSESWCKWLRRECFSRWTPSA